MMDQETKALMSQMAEAAADTAVRPTLVTIGIDPRNPIETKRDMAALRELRELTDDEEFRMDMVHLRRWRKTMDSVESKGTLAAVGLVCVGGLALILYAFRFKIFGTL